MNKDVVWSSITEAQNSSDLRVVEFLFMKKPRGGQAKAGEMMPVL